MTSHFLTKDFFIFICSENKLRSSVAKSKPLKMLTRSDLYKPSPQAANLFFLSMKGELILCFFIFDTSICEYQYEQHQPPCQ